MKLGSLFTGGGLGDFGFMAAGFEISWQVEIDDYCQKILALRYPETKKYVDIKKLQTSNLERVDIITGGFPCQPFSLAGNRKGKDDNRYLWPEMFRIIKELKPRWVIAENVPGIVNMAQFNSELPMGDEDNAQGDIGDIYHKRGTGLLQEILDSLKSVGYEAWPVIFPAHALGAWHKRDRIWIVCYSEHNGQSSTKESRSTSQRNDGSSTRKEKAEQPKRPSRNERKAMGNSQSIIGGLSNEQRKEDSESIRTSENISDTSGERFSSRTTNSGENGEEIRRTEFDIGRIERLWRTWWKSEPSVGRVANGIANRVHRLKMLGNGQVAACTYVIGKFIIEIENSRI